MIGGELCVCCEGDLLLGERFSLADCSITTDNVEVGDAGLGPAMTQLRSYAAAAGWRVVYVSAALSPESRGRDWDLCAACLLRWQGRHLTSRQVGDT